MKLFRISIFFVISAVLGLSGIGYLLHRFGPFPLENPYNYLTLLTLTVTIIAAVAALFSIGGVLMAGRAVDSARKIEREAVDSARKIERETEDVKEAASQAKAAIEAAKEETTNHLVAIRNSAGAFQPSGHFLSDGIHALATNPLWLFRV